MPGQVSRDNIIQAVLDGFVTAQTTYEQMSGGNWLWSAPEYLITTTVAQVISSLKGTKFVTLEDGAKYTLNASGGVGRGKIHSAARFNGRVDIVLWKANDTPRAVIEIKNQIYDTGPFRKDISRLASMLNRNKLKSSLKFGLFAFYQSNESDVGEAMINAEKRAKKIFDLAKEVLPDKFELSFYSSETFGDVKDAWLAGCILIKRKAE